MANELTFSINVSFSKDDDDTLDINWDDTRDVSVALSESRLYTANTTLAQITFPVVTNPQLMVWKNIGTANITIFAGNTTQQVALVKPGNVGLITVDSSTDLRQKTSSGTSTLKTGFVAT